MPKRKAEEREDVIVEENNQKFETLRGIPKDIWTVITSFLSLREMFLFRVNRELKRIFGKLIKERCRDLAPTQKTKPLQNNGYLSFCLKIERIRKETGFPWKGINEHQIKRTPWDGVLYTGNTLYDLKHDSSLSVSEYLAFHAH
eukprot:TRINITY_DN10701_c0_g2_i1.p1 TRINITY_DN10701_c0_g2~~TRINITY_DN10701_c0_g2_i1.p1  ORF type:complete len:144 (-),score=27.28 TRINITY_DN10701_c0_g2_i1:67-498(-)